MTVPANPTVWQALRSPRLLTREVLAGLVVGIALIPESIAFSVIAGVDPRVGLFSSFIMAVVISFTGGRRAMISAATGAVALVIAPVMRDHGYDYFIATVLLAGVFQIAMALLGVTKLLRFIPRSVMVGFVNALSILVLVAQLQHLIGVPFAVYPLVIAGLAILFFFPRLTRVVPAPLVALVVLTSVVLIFGIKVPNVGDQGELPTSLPQLFVPHVPLTFDTFVIIAPFAFAMALVGLLESLMTAKLVDDITDSRSSKTRESWGQGVANIVSGAFGGMGGCAMIGQTMINVRQSGARTRISTFCAGVFLLVLVLVLGEIVSLVPMAALVAIMIHMCLTTIDWHSVSPRTLRRMPKSETSVMIVTVTATILTHNLAVGVISGVALAAVLFARRVAHVVTVTREVPEPGVRVRYVVSGPLFFASSNDLTTQFDYANDPQSVDIDMTNSHVWDASSVAALDAIETKYARRGVTVTIVGLNDTASAFHQRLSGNLP